MRSLKKEGGGTRGTQNENRIKGNQRRPTGVRKMNRVGVMRVLDKEVGPDRVKKGLQGPVKSQRESHSTEMAPRCGGATQTPRGGGGQKKDNHVHVFGGKSRSTN